MLHRQLGRHAVYVLELRADEQGDQLRPAHRRNRDPGHPVTVAEHSDRRGHLENLVQPVCHVENPDPASRHRAHDRQQLLNFRIRQRGRRLVEHQQ